MDPRQWPRAKELFHAALAREPDRRAAFLLEAAPDDPSLRETVAAMLARQLEASRFLETPAVEAAAMALAAELDPDRVSSRPGLTVANAPPQPATEGPTRRRSHASRRPPWWMVVLAVIFVADAGLRAWGYVFGPMGFGFTPVLKQGRYVVSAVTAGGLADHAGVEPGDVILALDGRPYALVSDPRVTGANLEVGRTYRFETEREGRRRAVNLSMRRRVPNLRNPGAHAMWQVAMLAMLATGLLIAFARPADRLARLGALTLASLGMSFYVYNLPPGYAQAVRGLPWGLGALLVLPNLAVPLAGPIGLSFFLLFPRPFFRARWPWALVWLPVLASAPAFTQVFYTICWPEQAYARTNPEWIRTVAGLVYSCYGAAMLAAITANYVRLKDLNEKRRLRVLVAGGAAGSLPGLARLFLMNVAPGTAVEQYLSYGWPDFPIALGFLLFPISFAYALLRHRVLGVRVIVRLGVQYALARGLVISLVPLLGLLLVADALVHGNQPLIQIVEARGWIYALLGALAVLVHSQRQRMAAAIDRRFFREHYDARQLLRDVAEQVRRAGHLEDASSPVVARVEAALHPAFAALMLRAAGEPAFHPVASAPAGAGPPVIAAEGPLIAQLRATERPVRTSGWYANRKHPPDDLADTPTEIELIVPIAASAERDEALLALGPKRAEEPYTQEDIDALVAIAASLALLLDGPATERERLSSRFEECPECGACYDTGATECAREGGTLVRVTMPRILAGRYRLERRFGRGGMGKVYEATDTALERRVAIKVIRDEWVHSSPAIERFRREARAVARLDHPNVVTVHDYGIETGRRAFLVMELLEGLTLRDELRRSARLTAPRTVEVLRGVCSAVDAAHRHKIVHRDLKPENVFLVGAREGRGPTIKVLDFGVAKPLAGSTEDLEAGGAPETEAGVLVGTVGYISPEQLLGDRPDVSWDLWALAVVAYECLAGVLPFPVPSREAWRRSVLAGRPTPIANHLPDAPGAWQDFFSRSLATDRTRRPQTAAEFLGQLEAALG